MVKEGGVNEQDVQFLTPAELVLLGKMDEKVRAALDLVGRAYETLLSLPEEERRMVDFEVRLGLSDGVRERLRGAYEAQCEAENEKPSQYHLAPFQKFGLASPTLISLNGAACEGPCAEG